MQDFLDLKEKTWHESTNPEAPFFARSCEKQYTVIALQKSSKKAVEEDGLRDDTSIHSARHTYAKFLLHDTGNMKYVLQQLGNSNISMTAVYADILPEENGKLANQISRD